MRRLSIIIVMVGLAVSACGGASSKTARSVAPTTTIAPEQAITQAWTAFFSAATPPTQSIAYLQHGQNYQPQIAGLLKLMPPGLTSKVHAVNVTGPASAMVTYELYSADGHSLLGKPSTGTAVLENGHWLVSSGTFCGLASLAGVKCDG